MTSSDSSLSDDRVALYYGGMALSVVGLLLFFSVFLAGIQQATGRGTGTPPTSVVWVPEGQDVPATMSGCGPSSFDCNAEVRTFSGKEPPSPSSGWNSSPTSSDPPIGRAFAGMFLILIGGVMMNIGKAGLRGSGIVLDPQGAREDLKPWNVARGGMLDDTLRGSEVATGMVERASSNSHREVVKVRCPNCRALNDEDARFCKSCGASLA